MKKQLPTIFFALVFITGLSLFIYPTLSNFWNGRVNDSLIGGYEQEMENLDSSIRLEAMKDAKRYNKNMYNKAKLSRMGLTYENVLNVKNDGIMGYIEIPKISVSLVIYHGIDDGLLQNGIGHVKSSTLPVGGKGTHSVLAGHTGLPSAKLLTNLDQLTLGDRFYIHVLDEVLQYRVNDISVVEPDEISKLQIRKNKDYVTLVTCTPYGVNSHRLLVRGTRVKENELVYQGAMLQVANDVLHINPIYLIPIGLIVLALCIWIIRTIRKIWVKKKGRSVHEEGEKNETE